MAGPIATSGSPGHMAYCYVELAVSSLAVAKTIVSTHCATHGGMARLNRPGWAWLNTRERSPIPILTVPGAGVERNQRVTTKPDSMYMRRNRHT